MAKKKAKQNSSKADAPEAVSIDPFIGGEDDDLSDMEYIQDETTTTRVETHPPETKEEAETLKSQEPDETEDEVAEDETAEASEEESDDSEDDTEETAKEEPEETAEAEDTEEEVLSPKIPKERFDEVNQRMKKAEDEVQLLKEQLNEMTRKKPEPEPEPEPFDYDGKEAAAMEALLEGDTDKYKAIRNEIRNAEKAETLYEAKKLAAKGDSELQESLTFDEAGAKIESEYPQLVPDTEGFNKAAYDELMELYVGYSQSGRYSRVEALQKAADKAVRLYDLKAAGQTEEDPKPDNVVDIKKPDIKGKTKAAKNQPPRMESSAVGEGEPTLDVRSMSDEEFNALPESTKRRIRGDVL